MLSTTQVQMLRTALQECCILIEQANLTKARRTIANSMGGRTKIQGKTPYELAQAALAATKPPTTVTTVS